MCNSCPGRKYGQDQSEARADDKARLDKVQKARETKVARKANAHLN
jgi:hypothetical protein